MNPFYNPIFLSKIAKAYLFDIQRLKKISDVKLKRYQDHQLKKMVRFAYTVPLYHDKYKKARVHPNDISGIKDLRKLPLISKEDIKQYYPDGILETLLSTLPKAAISQRDYNYDSNQISFLKISNGLTQTMSQKK